MKFKSIQKTESHVGFSAKTDIGELTVELVSPKEGVRITTELCGSVVGFHFGPAQWNKFVEHINRMRRL